MAVKIILTEPNENIQMSITLNLTEIKEDVDEKTNTSKFPKQSPNVPKQSPNVLYNVPNVQTDTLQTPSPIPKTNSTSTNTKPRPKPRPKRHRIAKVTRHGPPSPDATQGLIMGCKNRIERKHSFKTNFDFDPKLNN